MKTTLDLPDGLLKQVKLRAVHEGLKLKDAVAHVLREGLAAAKEIETDPDEAPISKDKRTGLPDAWAEEPRPGVCLENMGGETAGFAQVVDRRLSCRVRQGRWTSAGDY